MAVWVVQHDDGKITDGPRKLDRPDRFSSDVEYLAAKAESHAANGWNVEDHGNDRLVATKRRGVDTRFTKRTIWIE